MNMNTRNPREGYTHSLMFATLTPRPSSRTIHQIKHGGYHYHQLLGAISHRCEWREHPLNRIFSAAVSIGKYRVVVHNAEFWSWQENCCSTLKCRTMHAVADVCLGSMCGSFPHVCFCSVRDGYSSKYVQRGRCMCVQES